MDDFVISIVITTYHRPERIVIAVENALAQNCNKEILVVDDNGRNTEYQKETERVLVPYLNRITYLVNDVNHGPSYSRNQGINQATGKYITFYDDDDEIHPDKLSHQAKLLEVKGEQYSCCYCDYTKILGENNYHTNGEHGEGNLYPYMLGRTFYIGSGSNLLVRASVIKEVGGYNETLRRFEDYEFISRITEHYLVAYLPKDLMTIHYEVRDNPDLHNVSYEKLVSDDEKYFAVIKEKLEVLPEQKRTMILKTAALERWRYALSRKKTADAIQNMKQNGVSLILFVRYICYLLDRVIRKKSYGFKAY